MSDKVMKMWIKTKKKSQNQRRILLIAVIISTGIFSQFYAPGIVRRIIFENFKLTPNSSSFPEWKRQSSPNEVKIFIFNWTNPQEISNISTKPSFQQLGPYKFIEYPSKHNITFNNENSTVSYRKSSSYFFDSDNSSGSLDDMLVVLNLLAVSASSKIHHHGPQKQLGLSTSLNAFNQKIHVTKSVREMLFDGYTDIMVTLGAIFTGSDKIGFLVNKNGSEAARERFTINSGSSNILKLGQIEHFNDLSELPHYNGDCRKLHGSAGDFLPPNTGTANVLYIFIADLCRSMPFEYVEDVKVNGITGRRYILGARAIDNGTAFPENQCFSNDSFPSGAINISECSIHLPTFVSYPHFYLADLSFGRAVDGLSPNKYEHESHIVVEPKTGVILQSILRFQTNIHLRRSEVVAIYKKVPNILIPLFIVDQKYTINIDKAAEVKIMLFAIGSADYFGYFLIIVGVFMILVLEMSRRGLRKRNNDNLYNMQLLVDGY